MKTHTIKTPGQPGATKPAQPPQLPRSRYIKRRSSLVLSRPSLAAWLAPLALLAALAALPLNTSAANKYVTASGTDSTDMTDTAKTYEDNGSNRAALQVDGAAGGVFYEGKNVTLTSTGTAGNSRYGAYVYNQGSLSLYSSTITSSGSAGGGVRVTNTASGYLENVYVKTSGHMAYGAYAATSSTLVVKSGTISTDGEQAMGIYLNALSTGSATDVYIETSGTRGRALILAASSTLTAERITISTTGAFSQGVYVDGTSTGKIDVIKITTYGDEASGLFVTNSGTLTVNHAEISVGGYRASGMGAVIGGVLAVADATVKTTGEKGFGVMQTGAIGSTVNLTNGRKTYRHVDPGQRPGKPMKETPMKLEALRVLGNRGTKWLKAHLRQAGCGPLGARTLPVSGLKRWEPGAPQGEAGLCKQNPTPASNSTRS